MTTEDTESQNAPPNVVPVLPLRDVVVYPHMKPGEVRGPVRTQFGYHIIRLDETQSAKQKALEDVRGGLEAEYRKQEAEKVFGERQEQLADKAFEHLDDIDAVAKEVSLPVQEIAEFTREGGGPLGRRDEVIAAIFDNNDVLNGQNSQPLELSPGDVVVVHVVSRREPTQKPLADVRAQIVEQLRQEGASSSARRLAAELAEKLRAGATSWSQVATEHKLKTEGPKYVNRSEATLPIEVRNALFAALKPDSGPRYQSVPLGNGDAALLAFSGVRQDASAEAAQDQQNRERGMNARVGMFDGKVGRPLDRKSVAGSRYSRVASFSGSTASANRRLLIVYSCPQ